MTTGRRDDAPAARIGDELRHAREAQGLTIADLVARTKIRRRYLEALEQGRWAALPSAAHAKAFMRVVAEELGLDPDPLVDRMRRLIEPRGTAPDTRRQARWPVLAAVGVLAGVLVATAVVVSGRDEQPRERDRAEREGGRGDRDPGREGRQRKRRLDAPFDLTLVAREPIEVCLVNARRQALIDAQRLGKGTVEGPFRDDEFRLDLLSGGSVRVRMDGISERLESREPARFLIGPAGVEPAPFRRARCP